MYVLMKAFRDRILKGSNPPYTVIRIGVKVEFGIQNSLCLNGCDIEINPIAVIFDICRRDSFGTKPLQHCTGCRVRWPKHCFEVITTHVLPIFRMIW